ncbi:hypothetical protein GGH93_006124 [Coemansia aciculifera]|nr:hypothetical protein GGH93_006124 [Coemansia aciculifera]
MSNASGHQSGRGGGGGRGGRQPGYRGGGSGGSGPGRGRGMGGGSGRGRGRGSGERYDNKDHREGPNIAPSGSGRDATTNRIGHGPIPGRGTGDNHHSTKPGHLIPVKPSSPTPWASIAWRVLYVVPPNARSELGLAGEKIPGPFSPPLHPSTPEQAANAGPRKPQDVLRKQNEVYAMKQRVQQLLQQAADSPSGGIGTYVGRLSHNNNPLIPVLPRLDP